MSLNQRYTWKDFLNENPELKGKKIKRTSPEGKKAFEVAYKAKIKDVLKDRLAWIEKEVKRATEKKTSLVAEVKSVKKKVARKKVQTKIGAAEKYIYKLGKTTEKIKQVQKGF